MRIDIRRIDIPLSERTEATILRRLETALAHYEDRITTAHCVLSDVNGPKGGLDRCCRIAVKVAGDGEHVVTGMGETVLLAASAATAKIGSRLSRALKKARDRKRGKR